MKTNPEDIREINKIISELFAEEVREHAYKLVEVLYKIHDRHQRQAMVLLETYLSIQNNRVSTLLEEIKKDWEHTLRKKSGKK